MEFCKKFGKSLCGIDPLAEQALLKFSWRGNVRELKNIIERATLISNGPQLTLADFDGIEADSVNEPQVHPDELTHTLTADGIDLVHLLADIEKRYIEQALQMTGANETRAAKLLHMKYSTLRYRRRILNIP